MLTETTFADIEPFSAEVETSYVQLPTSTQSTARGSHNSATKTAANSKRVRHQIARFSSRSPDRFQNLQNLDLFSLHHATQKLHGKPPDLVYS